MPGFQWGGFTDNFSEHEFLTHYDDKWGDIAVTLRVITMYWVYVPLDAMTSFEWRHVIKINIINVLDMLSTKPLQWNPEM